MRVAGKREINSVLGLARFIVSDSPDSIIVFDFKSTQLSVIYSSITSSFKTCLRYNHDFSAL